MRQDLTMNTQLWLIYTISNSTGTIKTKKNNFGDSFSSMHCIIVFSTPSHNKERNKNVWRRRTKIYVWKDQVEANKNRHSNSRYVFFSIDYQTKIVLYNAHFLYTIMKMSPYLQ